MTDLSLINDFSSNVWEYRLIEQDDSSQFVAYNAIRRMINVSNITVFHENNIHVLRGLNSNSVDLIYLDPPFNKNDTFVNSNNQKVQEIKKFFIKLQKDGEFKGVDFNQVFKDDSAAFSDVWSKDDLNDEYYKQIDDFDKRLVVYIDSVRDLAPPGGFYYLIYMAIRLIEMRRILKDDGSLYLHCDPTFSHYLKTVLDLIFGVDNFMSDIVWKRYAAHSVSSSAVDTISDNILYFAKNKEQAYAKTVTSQLSAEESNKLFSNIEIETGRRYQHISLEQRSNKSSAGQIRKIMDKSVKSEIGWRWSQKTFDQRLKANPLLIHWTKSGRPRYKLYADEYQGKPTGNIWIDVQYLSSNDNERTGYPTQKPLALLERIIEASSQKGEVVLDPFCGCATTCLAAEKLGRQWIGIDKNPQTYYMIYYRAFMSDFLSVEDKPDLFKNDDLIQTTQIPVRTDLTDKERNLQQQSQQDLKIANKLKSDKSKPTKLSVKERQVIKNILYAQQAGLCNGCDIYIPTANLTLDHIIPKSQAGLDVLENIQLLCHRDNIFKADKPMSELFKKLLDENLISQATYDKQVKHWRAYQKQNKQYDQFCHNFQARQIF